jgi:uncharacterized glyoxalase superfamily protein PhnB
MTTTTITPFLVYREPGAAVAWLERAFGLELVRSSKDGNGALEHAELALGSAFVMVTASGAERELIARDDRGGASAGVHVHVDDVEPRFERARAAGADIVMELQDTDYDAREFVARDPEGHLWSFGTYVPGG